MPSNKLIRTLISLGLPVVLIIVGFLAANYIQPERFAGANDCVTVASGKATNQCDEEVSVMLCYVAPDRADACSTLRLRPEEAGRFPPPPEGTTGAFSKACEAPFVPALVSNANNAALKEPGCRS